MTETTAIFLHIPKAAGTTLHRIIERQYRPDQIYSTYRTRRDPTGSVETFMTLGQEQLAAIRMLKGHLPFGLHTRLPVERVISFYYFVRRNPEHYLYDYLKTQEASLQQYVDSRTSVATDNLQTRLLAGLWGETAYGNYPDDILDIARRNLSQHFSVVGLAERFDETLLLLQHAYHWGNVLYIKENVTRNRPVQQTIPAETLATIRAHNRLDIELYCYAQALFETLVHQQGAAFQAKLRAFQALNCLSQSVFLAQRYIRKHSVRAYLRQLVKPRTPTSAG